MVIKTLICAPVRRSVLGFMAVAFTMLSQLAVAALYVLGLFYLTGR